ncbi:MAG: hypothetical protein Q4C54_07050 [Clostridia bacterium]|nr:hypothetical protein [Clostridia bacterium]
MGVALEYRCTGCRYTFTAYSGYGMMYPAVYQETMTKARKGRLGETLRRFVREHPEGAISCEDSIICCTECGRLHTDLSLDMYLPKGKLTAHENGPWSIAMPDGDADYVSPADLQEYYRLTARYPHKCKKCGAPAEIISQQELQSKTAEGTIVCPRCGGRLKTDGLMLRCD